jgi:hypothetical protein
MSYSLIDIPKENYLRLINDTTPLYIPMGALSAADATTLTVGLVCSAFSGTSASITMEESYDGGVTYDAVPSFTADLVNATGTFKIKVDAANGPLSPVVRLKVEAAAATTLYFSRVFRTFVQSNVMVPRDVTVSSAAATEATQIQVLGQLAMIEGNTDGLEALIAATNVALGVIDGRVDGVEALLTTIAGYVDGVETLVTATNTKLDTANGYIDGLETLVTSTNTKLDKLASGLVKVAFDYFAANYSGATTDVWTYKTGGSGGTTVATVTITYVDSSKAQISTVGVV